MSVIYQDKPIKSISVRATGSARINIIESPSDEIHIIQNNDGGQLLIVENDKLLSIRARPYGKFALPEGKENDCDLTIMVPEDKKLIWAIGAVDTAHITCNMPSLNALFVCAGNGIIQASGVQGEILIDARGRGQIELLSQVGEVIPSFIAEENSKIIARNISLNKGTVTTKDNASALLGECDHVDFEKRGHGTITVSNKNMLPSTSPFFA